VAAETVANKEKETRQYTHSIHSKGELPHFRADSDLLSSTQGKHIHAYMQTGFHKKHLQQQLVYIRAGTSPKSKNILRSIAMLTLGNDGGLAAALAALAAASFSAAALAAAFSFA
jgi:hypothetical protein